MEQTRCTLQAPYDRDFPKSSEQCREGLLPCQFEAREPPARVNRWMPLLSLTGTIVVSRTSFDMQNHPSHGLCISVKLLTIYHVSHLSV